METIGNNLEINADELQARLNPAITINGEIYAFDLVKMRDFCLTSDKDHTKEQEKIENFEMDDELSMMKKVSTISREVKTAGNPQNDSIVYDMLKLFAAAVLSSEASCNDKFSDMDFPTAIAFNTLLMEGLIYKIEKK